MARQAMLAGQIGNAAYTTPSVSGLAAGSSDWVSKSSNFSQAPSTPTPTPTQQQPSDPVRHSVVAQAKGRKVKGRVLGAPIWRERRVSCVSNAPHSYPNPDMTGESSPLRMHSSRTRSKA